MRSLEERIFVSLPGPDAREAIASKHLTPGVFYVIYLLNFFVCCFVYVWMHFLDRRGFWIEAWTEQRVGLKLDASRSEKRIFVPLPGPGAREVIASKQLTPGSYFVFGV